MGKIFVTLMAAVLPGWVGVAWAKAPVYEEVLEVLRTNLPGVTDVELRQASLDGLLQRFDGLVSLLTNNAPAPARATEERPLVEKAALFEETFAYLRVGRVGAGLAEALISRHRELTEGKQAFGLVLDLRFAAGEDFAQAAFASDPFLPAGLPLLEWKGKAFEATDREKPFAGPLVVLVNQRTRGAAEILAALLRENRAAIVIGAPTAGQTVETRDLQLSSGQILRVATAAVKLGNGQWAPVKGLRPDILVSLDQEEEKAFWEDPYRLAGSRAGLPERDAGGISFPGARTRLNEAELVRLKELGEDGEREPTTSVKAVGPEKKQVRDPVLARGLDLLKGLSVVKSSKSL